MNRQVYRVRGFLFEVGKLSCLEPLRRKAEFGDPFFDVRNVEFIFLYFENTGNVFELTKGFSHLCPFKLGDNYILRRQSKDVDSFNLCRLTTRKGLLMKGSVFLKDDIYLPSSFHIENVEHGFAPTCFQSGIYV